MRVHFLFWVLLETLICLKAMAVDPTSIGQLIVKRGELVAAGASSTDITAIDLQIMALSTPQAPESSSPKPKAYGVIDPRNSLSYWHADYDPDVRVDAENGEPCTVIRITSGEVLLGTVHFAPTTLAIQLFQVSNSADDAREVAAQLLEKMRKWRNDRQDLLRFHFQPGDVRLKPGTELIHLCYERFQELFYWGHGGGGSSFNQTGGGGGGCSRIVQGNSGHISGGSPQSLPGFSNRRLSGN